MRRMMSVAKKGKIAEENRICVFATFDGERSEYVETLRGRG